MGQYYLICNIDKKEYLYSHKFGDGLKLLEFGSSSEGMLTGLTILLADGNNRGGGDLRSEHPIIGSWAGDRIVIAGDYADEGKFVPEEYKELNLYQYVDHAYKDISETVMEAMLDDCYLAQALSERLTWQRENTLSAEFVKKLEKREKELHENNNG